MIIDLWSGIAGSVFAFLALGMRVIVLAAEKDSHAVARAQLSFPNIVHVEFVEEVTAKMVEPVLRKRFALTMFCHRCADENDASEFVW